MGMDDQRHSTSRPGRFIPGNEGRYLPSGLGGVQGAGLEVLEKKNNFVAVGILTPPIVQPVASS
jgi:hypothetical protein